MYTNLSPYSFWNLVTCTVIISNKISLSPLLPHVEIFYLLLLLFSGFFFLLARQVAEGLNSAFVSNQERKQNLSYLNFSKTRAKT